jgi:hypothetical protein
MSNPPLLNLALLFRLLGKVRKHLLHSLVKTLGVLICIVGKCVVGRVSPDQILENVPGVARSGTLGQHSWLAANVFRSPEIDWVVIAPCNFTFQFLSRRCANRTDALSTAITMSNL